MATISLIAAIDMNNAIGYKNKLLFKNKEDMQWFKEHTLNKICIMGRSTYESIGKPLKNRINVVLTKNKDYNLELNSFISHNTLIKHDLHEALKCFDDEDEIMIIGGESIYRQAFPYADRLYITKVHHRYDKADSYFPKFDENNWQEKYFRDGKKGLIPYSFHIYNRVK